MDAINLGFKIERCLGTDKELEEAQQALKKLGVTLTSDDGYLNIRIDNKHGSSCNVGRHKKIMMESNYYKSLDKKKFEDLDYLKSVDGDRIF